MAALPELAFLDLDADRDPIAQMADAQPGLIVVDADHLPPWTAEARSSPATRRIPMLGVGDDHECAHGYGITDCLTRSEFVGGLPESITRRLKVFGQIEALRTGCESPLPTRVLQGLREFNAGAYYDAHETLEHAWNEETGPVRDTYRAILQVAVAYYQIQRGNYNGALKMFLRMVQWFAPLPDTCQGIDIAGLRADAAAARAHLETLGAERITDFDKGYLKPVRF